MQEVCGAESAGEVEHGLPGPWQRRHRRDGQGAPARDGQGEDGEGREQQGVSAGGDEQPADDRASGVAEAFARPVPAENSALPVAGGQPRDHGAGGGGERRGRCALTEPDDAQQGRVPDHDKPG